MVVGELCPGVLSVHLDWVKGIMKKEGHVKVLKVNLKKLAAKLGLGHYFVFQQDNPKHASLLMMNYLHKTKVNVIEWNVQSPDFDPIENIQSEDQFHTRRPSNLEELAKE